MRIIFPLSGGKKTVFLVNSVPLVTQQKDYLARHLDLQCIGLCGDDGVDDWKADKWNEVIKKNQVIGIHLPTMYL